MTKSDSELDSLGRVSPKDIGCTPLEMGIHEWSEWVRLLEYSRGFGLISKTPRESKIKIRVCKKCKKAEHDLI